MHISNIQIQLISYNLANTCSILCILNQVKLYFVWETLIVDNKRTMRENTPKNK